MGYLHGQGETDEGKSLSPNGNKIDKGPSTSPGKTQVPISGVMTSPYCPRLGLMKLTSWLQKVGYTQADGEKCASAG